MQTIALLLPLVLLAIVGTLGIIALFVYSMKIRAEVNENE